METKLPIIAVLLTCHNRKEKTLRCLKHLFAQEGRDQKFRFEVFLVDDASTDGTSRAVEEQFSEVHLIQGDGNLYWNRGMHLAWTIAANRKEYDYFLWLNDDTSVFPDAIGVLLDSYLHSGANAVIGGATKSEISNAYTYGGKTREGKDVIPNGSVQECLFMNGNVVLISNRIFKRVGFIDALFHHAIGDRDYGLRAIKKGFRILITPVYVGYCEANEKLPKWCLTEVPFRERIRSLYSPLGNSHPYYFFVYEKRHFGFLVAMKHYFSIHLRVLIPSLWK